MAFLRRRVAALRDRELVARGAQHTYCRNVLGISAPKDLASSRPSLSEHASVLEKFGIGKGKARGGEVDRRRLRSKQ